MSIKGFNTGSGVEQYDYEYLDNKPEIPTKKSDIGLGNVDNTSDLDKPISTATQTALNEKVPNSRKVNGKALSADVTLTSGDIGYDGSTDYDTGTVGKGLTDLNRQLNELTESYNTNVGIQSANLYDNSKDTDGIVISGSGVETANSSFKTSDYIQTTDDPSIANRISIKGASTYLGTDGATFVAVYGENKNFLVRYDAYANPNGFINVHATGMKYIRVCANINASAFMVNLGTSIAEFTPYGFIYSDGFINEVDKLVDEALEESTAKPYKWSTKEIPNEGFITSDYTGIATYNPTLSELYGLYDALMTAYPNYITKTDLGLDQSGEYHLYKYSFVPEKINVVDTIYTLPNPPKILLGSGTHGDGEHGDKHEMVVGLYYLFKNICDNWRGNEALTFLRWHVRFDIIPVQNPWGYVNNNRRNSRLVDINRNFPYGWRSGASGSVDYGGTAALSEAESVIIKNFIESNTDALFYCDIHTTGGNPTQDRMIYFDMLENVPFSVISNDVVIQLSEKWNSEQIQGLTDIDFHGYIFSETPHGAINHWVTRYYMPSCVFEGFPNFVGSEITADGDKIMSMCLDEMLNVILSALRYFKYYN